MDIIVCAESINKYYWKLIFMGIGLVVPLIVFGLIALNRGWNPLVLRGVVFAIAVVIIILLGLFYHKLTNINCGKCISSRHVKVIMESGRLVIYCTRCQVKFNTDCVMPYAGGPPQKIK